MRKQANINTRDGRKGREGGEEAGSSRISSTSRKAAHPEEDYSTLGVRRGYGRYEAEWYRANQDRWSIMAATGWSDPSPTYPPLVGRARGWFKPAPPPSALDGPGLERETYFYCT
ncbi:hypothetical protein KM043_014630 [Ampulex compressa]|nr:hypothetical protein KM043_014630 [Ampulex compressa]